jgi:hypothetical protein
VTALEREGIFKGAPVEWRVKKFDSSKSVAIGIDFVVTAQLDGSEWVDWSGYDEHRVSGDFWVVKKTGQPNIDTVKRLAEVLGWNGSLSAVATSKPPDVVVQITVKAEDYNGRTYFKVAWLNTEDYVPSFGCSEEEVRGLDAQFGSLLRAAAGSKGTPPPKASPKKPAPPPPAEAEEPKKADFDESPF